jgi:hypothetical protein
MKTGPLCSRCQCDRAAHTWIAGSTLAERFLPRLQLCGRCFQAITSFLANGPIEQQPDCQEDECSLADKVPIRRAGSMR